MKKLVALFLTFILPIYPVQANMHTPAQDITYDVSVFPDKSATTVQEALDYIGTTDISGVNWNQIGGLQTSVNVSGFNWENLQGINTTAINWQNIDFTDVKTINGITPSSWITTISPIILSGNNVGIGSSTPQGNLDVEGINGIKLNSVNTTLALTQFSASRSVTNPATWIDASGLVQLSTISNIPLYNYGYYDTTGFHTQTQTIDTEGAATNLLTYTDGTGSSGGLWTTWFENGGAGTSLKNQIVATDITGISGSNSQRIQYTGISGDSNASVSLGGPQTSANTVMQNTVVTFSIWIKSQNGNSGISVFKLYMNENNSGGSYLQTDKSGDISSSITSSWRKFTYTFTGLNAACSRVGMAIGAEGVNNGSSVDFQVWGPQLEIGSNSTSFIPTTTTSLTRNSQSVAQAQVTGGNFSVPSNAICLGGQCNYVWPLGAKTITIDGTTYTNDSTGIQSALNQCSTNGGGKVFLPAGLYPRYHLGQIRVPANCWLQGSGEGISTIQTTANGVQNSDPDNTGGVLVIGGNNTKISDLTVDANEAAYASGITVRTLQTQGISSSHDTVVDIENVEVKNTLMSGITLYWSNQGIVKSNYIHHTGQASNKGWATNGLDLYGEIGTYTFIVSGITTTPTAGATYTNNGITFTVTTTSISGGSGTINSSFSGTLQPQASGTLTKTGGTGDATISYSAFSSNLSNTDFIVTDNFINDVGGENISLSNTQNAIISHNDISNGYYGIEITQIDSEGSRNMTNISLSDNIIFNMANQGINWAPTLASYGNTINGNVIYNIQNSGMYLSQFDEGNVSVNTLRNTNQTSDGTYFAGIHFIVCKNSSLVNNTISYDFPPPGTTSGIQLYASTFNTVDNNKIFSVGSNAIRADSGAQNNDISYNTINGNSGVTGTGIILESFGTQSNNVIEFNSIQGLASPQNFIVDNSGQTNNIYIGNTNGSYNFLSTNLVPTSTPYTIPANTTSISPHNGVVQTTSANAGNTQLSFTGWSNYGEDALIYIVGGSNTNPSTIISGQGNVTLNTPTWTAYKGEVIVINCVGFNAYVELARFSIGSGITTTNQIPTGNFGNVGIGTGSALNAALEVFGGNVGIGSAFPGQALDVNGTARMTGFTLSGNGAANGYVMVTNNVGIGTWMPASTLPISGGGAGTVSSVTLASPNSTLTLGGTNPITTSGTINGDINLTNANTWTGQQIFNTSNVGINSVSPGQRLDVTGTVRATGITAGAGGITLGGVNNTAWPSGTSQWTTQNTTDVSLAGGNVGIGTTVTNTSALTVMNGNVGIGTWVPNKLLDLGISHKFTVDSSGNVTASGNLASQTGSRGSPAIGSSTILNNSSGIYFNTGDGIFISSGNNDELKIDINATPNVQITSNVDITGNLGMGTTNPLGKLIVWAGNLGVGTNVPGQAIDVIGTVRATSFQGTNGTPGYNGTCGTTAVNTITVSNGIITSCTGV